MTHILYDPTTGEIVGTSTVEPMAFPGVAFVKVDVPDGHALRPNPVLHKIDLETLEIIDKTPYESNFASQPKSHEIRHIIASELSNSDQYMVPDRAMSEDKRAAWATYRQALRDLSKKATTVEMLEAWPVRPDGTDAAAFLRSRI